MVALAAAVILGLVFIGNQIPSSINTTPIDPRDELARNTSTTNDDRQEPEAKGQPNRAFKLDPTGKRPRVIKVKAGDSIEFSISPTGYDRLVIPELGIKRELSGDPDQSIIIQIATDGKYEAKLASSGKLLATITAELFTLVGSLFNRRLLSRRFLHRRFLSRCLLRRRLLNRCLLRRRFFGFVSFRDWSWHISFRRILLCVPSRLELATAPTPSALNFVRITARVRN